MTACEAGIRKAIQLMRDLLDKNTKGTKGELDRLGNSKTMSASIQFSLIDLVFYWRMGLADNAMVMIMVMVLFVVMVMLMYTVVLKAIVMIVRVAVPWSGIFVQCRRWRTQRQSSMSLISAKTVL